MGQTLLANIQDVCLELGIDAPVSVIGNPEQTTQQLLALMNRVGNNLISEENWQALSKEHRFTTEYVQLTGNVVEGTERITALSDTSALSTDFQVIGNGIQQDTFVTGVASDRVTLSVPAQGTYSGETYTFGRVKYDMPSDFDRMVNKTQYNRSNRWAIIGPKDAQEWQWLKSSYITTGPRMRYRIVNDQFVIWPIVSGEYVFGFEYQSNGWVLGANGTAKSKFSLDTDTSFFPDKLLVIGTKLKFFEIKGFDTTALLQDFNRELSKFKAQNAGADTLSLAPRYANVLLSQNQLPDTGLGNITN